LHWWALLSVLRSTDILFITLHRPLLFVYCLSLPVEAYCNCCEFFWLFIECIFPAINTVFFLFHLFHLSPFALLQHAPEWATNICTWENLHRCSVCDPAKIFVLSKFSYPTPPIKQKIGVIGGRLLIANHLDQS
jgi:hypothetical protein